MEKKSRGKTFRINRNPLMEISSGDFMGKNSIAMSLLLKKVKNKVGWPYLFFQIEGEEIVLYEAKEIGVPE